MVDGNRAGVNTSLGMTALEKGHRLTGEEVYEGEGHDGPNEHG
jgi:hypothetical protein